MKIILKKHQTIHAEKLENVIDMCSAGIDVSTTGAGKTYVALHLALKFNLPMWILAPKSVCEVWRNLTSCMGIRVEHISTYTLMANRRFRSKDPMFVVCDEFHMLKNNTNRSRAVQRFLHSLPENSKSLFLSATPYDKKSCEGNIRNLYRAATGLDDFHLAMSSMDFVPNVKLSVSNRYYKLDTASQGICQDGIDTLHRIYRLRSRDVPPPPSSIAKLITIGTRDIHQACTNTVIRVAKQTLDRDPTKKVIIVGKFHITFDQIQDELSAYGVVRMDGKSKGRDQLIATFQESSTKNRVFVTSAQVGGVGVNLDDQDGSFPRTMIILPSYDGIDFVQCIGRIHRANTKSSGEVFVVYPKDMGSPILKNLTRKLKTMSSMSSSVRNLDIEDVYEL
ncbi:hypothetical protein OAV62_01275 [bacterium]|nr:hypothetical protein [bacterium]